MGEAKRRGTFEQRKAAKIASQCGLTNEQIKEAYHMNETYNDYCRRKKAQESWHPVYKAFFDQLNIYRSL